MSPTFTNDLYNDFYKMFNPISPASKVLIPLLDALDWKGNNSKIIEALSGDYESMDINALMETMANLKFKHAKFKKMNGAALDIRTLPILFVSNDNILLVLNIDEHHALIYDTNQSLYINKLLKELSGDAYLFQHAEEKKDSLVHQQNNWFNKLIIRFKDSFKMMTLLTFMMTLLDLLIPFFIIIIYSQIGQANDLSTLLITYLGVLIYISSSFALSSIRNRIINYISTRMGTIISLQTFTRLLYLSPSYTETASLSAQINRIKDFENLKRFVTSGIFINLLELIFSIIYVIAIFIIGGWIGFIPIITLIVTIGMGHVMRPFHKIKMENRVDSASERQQNLIELLRNTDEIKISGQKQHWYNRFKKITADNIYDVYQLGNYVSFSNNISFFITNASVLLIIYGGVLQVFNGRMNSGSLIGIILLYWKVLRSIRGAFSLSVQISGLQKSIAQINRFMKLPQDNSIKTDMATSKRVKGNVKFMDVSIRYNQTSKPALNNINFDVTPGEIVGLRGHDGAGKTTILKLILGMYKHQGGRILLDNINIKQLEPLSLRRSISYAPEKDIMFTGTLRQNIRFFNPSISDDSIRSLMNKTGLQTYMEYFGYTLDTDFSEQDIRNASMAFKKLFNLTRLLTREVNLYLLDEPENYLSQKELQHFMETIKVLAKEKNASVIIASKEPLIFNSCDKVIALNQGRILKAKKNKSIKKGVCANEKATAL